MSDTSHAAPIPAIVSPCIRVCAIDGRSGLCVGCHRSLKEIAGWSRLSPGERDAIMAALPRRAALAGAAP